MTTPLRSLLLCAGLGLTLAPHSGELVAVIGRAYSRLAIP